MRRLWTRTAIARETNTPLTWIKATIAWADIAPTTVVKGTPLYNRTAVRAIRRSASQYRALMRRQVSQILAVEAIRVHCGETAAERLGDILHELGESDTNLAGW